MPVTIQDIARSLDISHTTVSRVLNARKDQFISQATRDRVWSQAREMGYRPNRAARALVTGRTQQVALWMSSIYTAFHVHVIHEVEKQLHGTEYQMMIGAVETEVTGSPFAQWHVDGYLVFEGMWQVASFLEGQSRSSLPLVSMGGTNYRAKDFDYVGIDIGEGADEALLHLDTIGCQRIAFVGMEGDDPRSARYEQFIERTGRTPEYIRTPAHLRAEVRLTVREYVAAYGCPDAMFCFNDDVALGTYRALRDLGIRIPEDVAIVGCDGIEDTEYLDTPLTTIVLPLAEMCRTAWQFLERRMETPTMEPQQVMLRPSLAIRESTRRDVVTTGDAAGSHERP